MNTVIRLATYWIFQILNTITALGLFIAPKDFHESMFDNPMATYAALGFSNTALDMLHNVLRGQGAALLAVSLFLFILRGKDKRGYLLIALVTGLSLIAHCFTLRQHLDSSVVQQAVSSFNAIYGMMAVNSLVTVGALWTYFKSPGE